jgi:hypothetical protein
VIFWVFLALNLIAQFSRQIVVQILGLESPKVFENFAVRSPKFVLPKLTDKFLDDHIAHQCDFPQSILSQLVCLDNLLRGEGYRALRQLRVDKLLRQLRQLEPFALDGLHCLLEEQHVVA